MAYTASAKLSEQRRKDALEELADDIGSKTEAIRRLLDVAAEAVDAGIASGTATVPDELERLVRDADTGADTDAKEDEDGEDVEVPEQAGDVYENLPAEIERGEWGELGFTHDVPVPRDAIQDVKQSQNERIPALRANLNYIEETEGKRDYDRDELERVMREMFGASERSMRNYLKRAGEEGALYPMPSNDPDVWGRDAKQEWRAAVAASAADLDVEAGTVDGLPSKKARNIYGDASTRDLLKPRKFYNWFQGNERGAVSWPDYVLSAEQYRKDVWMFIREVSREVVTMNGSRTRYSMKGPSFREGDYARAWVALLLRIVESETFINAFTEDEKNTAQRVVKYARRSMKDTGEAAEQLKSLMFEDMAEMEALLSASNGVGDVEMSVRDAADVLGVKVGASTEAVKDAFKEVAFEHPDASDGDADVDMGRVTDAKAVLLAAESNASGSESASVSA